MLSMLVCFPCLHTGVSCLGYVLGVLVCVSCFTFQLLNPKTSYIEEFVGINTLNVIFIYFDINLRSYILRPIQKNQGSLDIILRSDTLKPI